MLRPIDKKDVISEPKDTKPKLKDIVPKLKYIPSMSECAGLKSKAVEEKDVLPQCKRTEMGMTDNCAICQVQLLDIYKSCPIKYREF